MPENLFPALEQVALFIDFDGTLVDFAATPDAVYMSASAVMFLDRLKERLGGAFALVSGRPISGLDRHLPSLAFAASGCHGAEIRLSPKGQVSVRGKAMSASVVQKFTALAGRSPGLVFEDKIYGGCFHFGTSTASRFELKKELSEIIAHYDNDLMAFLDGYGCEIKQRCVDKGTAITEFMEQPCFANRTPVYVGDDAANCAAFSTVKAAGGFAVHVGLEGVYPGADLRLSGVNDVYAWLSLLLNDVLAA